jgi:superfamily II DNA or RNA helicase
MPKTTNPLEQIWKDRPFLLLSQQGVGGALADVFYDGKHKAFRTQMQLAFNVGIVEKIFENIETGENDPFFLQRIKDQYIGATGFPNKIADDVISMWIGSLDAETICLVREIAAEKPSKIDEPPTPPENIYGDDDPIAVEPPTPPVELDCKYSPKQDYSKEEYYFPCGASKQDVGFIIKSRGLQTTDLCKNVHAGIYAILFSLLQAKTLAAPGEYLKFYRGEKTNYGRVYRLQMILLWLIRNNHASDGNELDIIFEGSSAGSSVELDAAFAGINYYATAIATLAGKSYSDLKRSKSPTGIWIDINDREFDIIVVDDSKKREGGKRLQWNHNNLIFKINPREKDHCAILAMFLKDFFGYESFRTGQIEMIAEMLNDNKRTLCIMPTGAGKSLVFYFVSMMRSYPTLVISPTDILIKDQVRNLSESHKIDDVRQIEASDDFSEYAPGNWMHFTFTEGNKLLYVTPKILLNADLLTKYMIRLGHLEKLGGIVLDEVHCISNWSHDFRPEYLMLSFLLLEYFGNTSMTCFTATANYTVVSDIKTQLGFDFDRIMSPRYLAPHNIYFEYISCDTCPEIIERAAEKQNDIASSGGKVMCFAKSEAVAKNFHDRLPVSSQNKTDIFKRDKTSSYYDFAKGAFNTLITYQDLGIGINLPGITDTIHVGMPISIAQYVQEIGRANRDGSIDGGSRYVYFQNRKTISETSDLLSLDKPMKELIEEVLGEGRCDNDLASAYSMILRYTHSPKDFERCFEEATRLIGPMTGSGQVEMSGDRMLCMQVLYVLFLVGRIKAWYIVDYKRPLFHIALHDSPESYSLSNMKDKTTTYYRNMGEFPNEISKTKRAGTLEEIIHIFIDWHYNQFLYYHREQANNMLDFLEQFKDESSDTIQRNLIQHFSLSLMSVEKTTDDIHKSDFSEIAEYAVTDVRIGNNLAPDATEETAVNIAKSIERNYSAKLDYFLFCYYLAVRGDFSAARFGRILLKAEPKQRVEILNSIYRSLESANNKQRIAVIDVLCEYFPLKQIIDSLYAENRMPQDETYVMLLVLCFNRKWGAKNV